MNLVLPQKERGGACHAERSEASLPVGLMQSPVAAPPQPPLPLAGIPLPKTFFWAEKDTGAGGCGVLMPHPVRPLRARWQFRTADRMALSPQKNAKNAKKHPCAFLCSLVVIFCSILAPPALPKTFWVRVWVAHWGSLALAARLPPPLGHAGGTGRDAHQRPARCRWLGQLRHAQ